jgi:tetratricopeptide (TPR) repeat protein
VKTFGTRYIVAAGVATLAVAVLNGDAAAQRGRNRAGASSLPQVACASGAPEATTFASSAQDALNRSLVARDKAPLFTQAATQARQGIQAGETNPYHHFLLGQAQVGLGNYASADSAFRRTIELCPEFAGEVREQRRNAYASLFQEGLTAYQANDTAVALQKWTAAGAVYNESPDAYFNAGVLLSGRGDDRAATGMYREALAAADRNVDTAAVNDVRDMKARAALSLSNLGVRAFQQDSFRLAQELLGEVLRANPNDRNALYVQALAFYKQERWQDLAAAANRVLTVDPLNYNTYLLLYNAQKALAEAAHAQNNAAAERQFRDQIVRALGRADSLPVQIDNVHEVEGGKLQGDVNHGASAAGSSHVLEFTLYGPAGELATSRVTVTNPAEGAKNTFEVAIPTVNNEPGVVMGWKYRLVP